MTTADYHRMGVAAKEVHQRERMREPSVVCPICDVHTTARDLLDHLAERCPGRRTPHPGSTWVSWRQALELGVGHDALSRWARSGLVRSSGEVQSRRYLLRDIATCLAWRRLLSTRDPRHRRRRRRR